MNTINLNLTINLGGDSGEFKNIMEGIQKLVNSPQINGDKEVGIQSKEEQDRNKNENTRISYCPSCDTKLRYVPSGTNKSGRKYNAFLACDSCGQKIDIKN